MKVKVYKTNDCPWCKKVITYLERKGCEIEQLNCSENEEYRKELIEKTKQTSVPVIDIEGEIILGFDRKAIDSKLEVCNG